MGRLRDYIRSFFNIPEEPLRPNDIPSNIHEDFSHQFGHPIPQDSYPSQPGPFWSSPGIELHEFHSEDSDGFNIFDSQGDDLFSQMEDMFDGFFQGFPFSQEFFHGPIIDGPNHPSLPPPANPSEPGCLRDQMLKQQDSPDIQEHYQNREQDNSINSWFGQPWRSPFENPREPQDCIDKDLDDEVESGQQSLDDILSKDKDSEDRSLLSLVPRISSQMYSSVTTIDSQGNKESRTTKQDASGRKEVTIIRKTGDQEHTIKTWTNQDGSEQTQENLINIDQDKLEEFNDRWKHGKENRPPLSQMYDSILEQLFGPRR